MLPIASPIEWNWTDRCAGHGEEEIAAAQIRNPQFILHEFTEMHASFVKKTFIRSKIWREYVSTTFKQYNPEHSVIMVFENFGSICGRIFANSARLAVISQVAFYSR